jgi:hypothetical protein
MNYFFEIKENRQRDKRLKKISKQKKPSYNLLHLGFYLLSKTYPFKIFLEITNFWISVVPSPMVHNLESR